VELRPPKANVYARLEQLGAQLEAGMKDAAKSAGVPVTFNRCGSMFCAYFTGGPVWSLADAMKSDRARFAKYFHGMLAEGIYLAPSQFEAGFISTAHSPADIEKTVKRGDESVARIVTSFYDARLTGSEPRHRWRGKIEKQTTTKNYESK
jgi:glutamate-1-semialdehyde 2,1-aminomutase